MKILLIEDDDFTQDLLEYVIKKRFNCEVLIARDGEQGLGKVFTEHPDVILLDLALPKLDGMSFVRIIHGLNLPFSVPVIVISAHVDDDIVKELHELGVHDIIGKPFSVKETIGRLSRFVTRREGSSKPAEFSSDRARELLNRMKSVEN